MSISFLKLCHPSRAIITKRVGAIDIGSNKIKFAVSDVNLAHMHICQNLLSEVIPLALGEDLILSQTSTLSEKIQHELIDTLTLLLRKAVPFSPQAYAAVATEFLRLATNKAEVVERVKNATGISIKIISQEEEAILGFLTASSAMPIKINRLISWDSGAGSFQIATKEDESYGTFTGNLGKLSMKNLLLSLQNKELSASPNPVPYAIAEEAIHQVRQSLVNFPDSISQKIQAGNIKVLKIGSHPFAGFPFKYSQEMVRHAIESRLGLSDEEIIKNQNRFPEHQKYLNSPPSYIVSNLIFTYGVMSALGIQHVQYCNVLGGNTAGLLLSPHYWTQFD